MASFTQRQTASYILRTTQEAKPTLPLRAVGEQIQSFANTQPTTHGQNQRHLIFGVHWLSALAQVVVVEVVGAGRQE
jgi:hypothetical protein